MLTKTDKADIKDIVLEATQNLRLDAGNIKADMNSLKKDVRKGFKKVHKDQETIIGFFNREVLELKRRVDKIQPASPISHQIKKP